MNKTGIYYTWVSAIAIMAAYVSMWTFLLLCRIRTFDCIGSVYHYYSEVSRRCMRNKNSVYGRVRIEWQAVHYGCMNISSLYIVILSSRAVAIYIRDSSYSHTQLVVWALGNEQGLFSPLLQNSQYSILWINISQFATPRQRTTWNTHSKMNLKKKIKFRFRSLLNEQFI